jgi:hypothetical protein
MTVNRRRFLGNAGRVIGGAAGAAGAGAIMRGTPQAGPGRAYAQPAASQATDSEHFGRMFQLPAFAAPTADVNAALIELGRPGGLLDAKDALDRGPKDLIVDLSLSANNPNNPTHTAGTTFMGQFMDTDITFEITSRLGVALAPELARNARTPAFDLDSVYGAGPIADQRFYDPADRLKFRIESGGRFEDLPRLADGTALISDPRNDQHLVLAGLHAAFLSFHNRAVDYFRQRGITDDNQIFAQARQLTTWHYQWLILHEFLPLFIGQPLVDDILNNGRRFYQPGGAAVVPVEFQAAAYRFGHSMVRPSYRPNLSGNPGGTPFFALIFDPSQEGKADPDDMRGGSRAPRRFIDWQTFFDFGDGEVKPNKRIDTSISTPLFILPLGAIASHKAPTALPQRTLLRHLTWELPSGQRIARQMGVTPLAPGDLQELQSLGVNFERETPLWYYILKEAELVADGLTLGPVGGRIVGEVFIGLLQMDPASFLSANPGWRPTLPSRSGSNDFRMVDFLTFAGVDPASRATGVLNVSPSGS